MRLYPPAWAMGRMSTRARHARALQHPRRRALLLLAIRLHRSRSTSLTRCASTPLATRPKPRLSRPKFAYFPFGGGSRQCIGESFAWMEGVLTVATIASKWQMSYVGNSPPVPQAKITLRPRDPLLMRLSAR